MPITNIISNFWSSHYNRKPEHLFQKHFQLEHLQKTLSVSLLRLINKFQDVKK